MSADSKNIDGKEESDSNNKSVNPEGNSFPGNLLKWILRFFAFIVILLIAVFIFIQTDFFNKLVLEFLLEKANESFAAKQTVIYAESLKGNIFKGLNLNKGSIKVKEDTLLKFNSIEIKYDIFALLKKEINVNSILINEPEINITKVKTENDSMEWNLDYFLKTEEEDEDTSKSEFDWGIAADDITIKNGSLRILEDKKSGLPIRSITIRNIDTFKIGELDVRELNLNLSAKYFPGKKEIDLKNLNLKTNSDFNLKNFSMQAEIDEKDTVTDLKNLKIITDRSEIDINKLKMNNLNPIDKVEYEEFGKNKTELDIVISEINFDDLTFFLPELNFLDSSVAFNLKAEGNYGDLNIGKLNLITPDSKYNFSGNVKNLDHPEEIYFDITGNDLEIAPSDTKIILPGLDIPDYNHLGKVYIPYLTYKGDPDRFYSSFDLKSNAGNAEGDVYLDLTGSTVKYKGDITTVGLSIGKIIKDKELESNISGKFNVDASGFDYKTATGRLNYSLKNTKFFGQNISSSDGQLNFNKGNVILDLTYNSDALKTKTKGKVNISNLSNISYDLKGTVSGLNISSFTKDNSQSSNLNFEFDVNGRGFNPESITGKFNIRMSPSTYTQFIIPSTPLEIEIDKNGMVKSITAKSDFINLEVSGAFDINSLVSVLAANTEKVSNDFYAKHFPDSLTQKTLSYTPVCKNQFLDYKIDVKDLSPLYSFTGNDTIKMQGILSGIISDSCGLFNLTSSGVLRKIEFNDSVFRSDSLILDLNISNEIAALGLEKFNADLEVNSDKLSIGDLPLDSTKVRIRFYDEKNDFLISTSKDSTINLFTLGNLEDSLIVRVDSVNFGFREFILMNNKDLIVKYNSIDSSEWIDFRQFALNYGNQKFTIKGKYSLTDSSDIKLTADNIKLATYQKLNDKDIDTTNIVSGNIRRLEIKYKGTPEQPRLNLEANSDVLKVGNTRIGRLDALINYENEVMKPDISFYNVNNTGNIKISGLLPFLNPFDESNKDSIIVLKKLSENDVNLEVLANNFQLKVLQQLLPYTSNLEGKLDGKINLRGTGNKPSLTGKMDVNDGRFFVTLNKMKYNFFAKLSTMDEKLLISNAKIYYSPEKSRFISASGYVDFTNLTLNDILIEFSGDLKAFDKKSGQTELGLSGDLWVGSGSPKLKLTGNAGRFDLTGNLVLIKGNVVFNPFIQQAYNIYTDDFTYGVIIDSLKSLKNPYGKIILESRDSDVVVTDLNLNPFEKILYVNNNEQISKKAKEKSGVFYYNLFIKTSENLYLKFIVNEKSQQEFFGNISTELYLDNNDNYQMSGRGTVNLGDNCYYKFFKKFDAKGRAIFNGPVTNPELNIQALYKGYATTGTGATGQQNLEDVIVELYVTGYASNPKLTISLNKNGRKESGSNATSDAISFLLFGKFKDQLSFEQSTSFGASIGASFLSNYVSSSLEDIFPFLINTNLSYIDSKTGSFTDNADVRFTAAIGDAIVRFGGQIFKGLANTDIVIDYPLNKLLKIQALSNDLFIRLEKVYDPFIDNSDVSNTTGTRAGALVYYRIKF